MSRGRSRVFLTPTFAGHEARSVQLTRAGHTAGELERVKGVVSARTLEDHLTPMEEVEHVKAALAYNYDDHNLWCRPTTPVERGA